MEDKPVRSVLGIYAADGGESAKAYDALRARDLGDARLFRADENAELSKRDGRERYAALRLEGECLIVAATAPSEVPAIVEQLQSVGSPAVFVVSEGLSDLAIPAIGTAPPGSESIEDFARRCAAHRGKPGTAKPRMLSRLLENERTLEASRCDLAEAARLEHELTAAAEWLLDNGHLIRTQIAEIRHHLPQDHHRILPANASGDPYIYELAKELVVRTDHSLNEANIRDCLRAYQQIAPLTIAELCSVPLLLRMALIGELAQLALQVSRKTVSGSTWKRLSARFIAMWTMHSLLRLTARPRKATLATALLCASAANAKLLRETRTRNTSAPATLSGRTFQ